MAAESPDRGESTTTPRRVLGRVGDVALWAGAILGVCSLLITVAGLLFAIHPLIFRSGSMAPTIAAGSLGLAHQVPADSVRTGDIVSVTTDDTRVTHRVITTRSDGDATLLRLRGDANQAADLDPYRVHNVDKLWFAVPGLGYVISWLSRPPGVFVLAGYAAVMLALVFRRRPASPGGDDDHHRPVAERATDQDAGGGTIREVPGVSSHGPARHAFRAATIRRGQAALAAMVLGGTAALAPAPSWAAFTDTVPIAGSGIGSYTVPTTPFTCGALGVLSVTFTWTAVPGATGYTLYYGSGGSLTTPVTGTSKTIVTAISGGTAWVTVNRNFGSTTWTSMASTKRTYTVAVVSACS